MDATIMHTVYNLSPFYTMGWTRVETQSQATPDFPYHLLRKTWLMLVLNISFFHNVYFMDKPTDEMISV